MRHRVQPIQLYLTISSFPRHQPSFIQVRLSCAKLCRSSPSALPVELSCYFTFHISISNPETIIKRLILGRLCACISSVNPLITIQLGIQQSTMYLLLDNEFSLHSNFTSSGLSSFIFIFLLLLYLIGNREYYIFIWAFRDSVDCLVYYTNPCIKS